MTVETHVQNRFTSGEVSNLLYGRFELDNYKAGLASAINMIPLVQGGITSRPGTHYVASAKHHDKKCVLIPFKYSIVQEYQIEFGDLYIRFYKDNGQILSAGVPYEVSSPYTEADLDGITFTQSADVLYLFSRTRPPMKLNRFGDTSWTLVEYTPEWPAKMPENADTAKLIYASATTGNGITLTASSATFNASHVGAYWHFREVVASKYTKWQTAIAVGAGAFRHFDGKLYQTTAGGTTGTAPPIHLTGTESDGAVQWTFVRGQRGYVKITGYTSSTVVTADVIKRLPDSALTPGTYLWSEGAWSTYRGYPACGTFHESRLWVASTTSNPQTIWASPVSEFESFRTVNDADETTAAEGLSLTIDSDDVNTIHWMTSLNNSLALGTSGGEWTIRGQVTSEAVSVTNIKADRPTSHTCKNIQPVKMDRSILFIQGGGVKLREMAYVFDGQNDGFKAVDLSVVCEHILYPGIRELAILRTPQPILFAVRDDGVLLCMTYSRDQDVAGGWTKISTDGLVESISNSRAINGIDDQLWMVVNRTIGGQTKRYIEYMHVLYSERAGKDESFYVDSGVIYDGSPVSSLTGLSHLEGKTVAILADGAPLPDQVVTSGTLTFSAPVSRVNAGLPFTASIKTLPINAGSQTGTAITKTRRIYRMGLVLSDTLGGKYAKDGGSEYDIIYRTQNSNMDQSPDLFTGNFSLELDGGVDTNAQLILKQSQPLPFTILAIVSHVSTQDR